MTTTHTPGPWNVDCGAIAMAGEIVCSTIPAPESASVAERRANARLIAAAPDMLAALKAALEALDASQPIHSRYPEPIARHREATKAAIAAIAKATGA